MLINPIAAQRFSLLDGLYYCFLAAVPIEFLGTAYFDLGVSLSTPVGIVFAFVFFVTEGKKLRVRLPWPMTLPLIWIVVTLAHYIRAPDFEFVQSTTGVINNLIFSIILYQYLRLHPRISEGLLVMGLVTCLGACAILMVEGLDVVRGSRFSILKFDTNNFGSILAFGALIIVLHTLNDPYGLKTIPFLGLVGACLAIVISTGSRGGALAFFLALSFHFLISVRSIMKPKALVIITCVAFAGMYFFEQSPVAQQRWEYTLEGAGGSRLSGREEIYEETLEMIRARPIFGWGVRDTFFEVGERVNYGGARGTHNTFLMIIASGGAVAGVAFLVFFAYPFFRLSRFRQDSLYKQLLVLFFFVLMIFMSLDWINRKQMWIVYTMLLAHLSLRYSCLSTSNQHKIEK